MNRVFLNIVEYYRLMDHFLIDNSEDLNTSLWNLQLGVSLPRFDTQQTVLGLYYE